MSHLQNTVFWPKEIKSLPQIICLATVMSFYPADCHLVRAPSADEIRRLSEANVFWSAKELQCISDDSFNQTVHGYLRFLFCLFFLDEVFHMFQGLLLKES